MYGDPYGSTLIEPYIPDDPNDGRSKLRVWLTQHRREPDAIPTPVGTGNAYTQFKYVFGSSRCFFGTADSSFGIWSKATVPPPFRDPYLYRDPYHDR